MGGPDVLVTSAPARAEPPRRGTAARLTRIPTTHAVFWCSLLLLAGSALIRNRSLFTTKQYPYSDQALNSLLVDRAIRFEQLVGNYSRVGFHHPGPALLYFLGWGQVLFRDVLHVVPDPYNGQVVGAVVYGAVFMSLALVSVLRLTGSRGATVLAFGFVFLFAAHNSMMGNVWFPFLYLPAFFLFMIAGAGVTAGRTAELPSFVLAAGVLVHGHVSFALFVVLTTAVAARGWLVAHRGGRRAELAAHRRAVIGAEVLAGVFALPVVLNTLLHFPGEWPAYFRYTASGHRAARTVGKVLSFTGQYWHIGVSMVLLGAAVVLAAVLTVRERNRERRRVFLALYGVAALQAVLTYLYVARGVDDLTRINNYTGLFARTIPLVVLIAAASQLWLFLTDLVAGADRIARGRAVRAATVAVPVAVAVWLSVSAATSAQIVARTQPDLHLPQLVTAVRDDPARAGRAIEYVVDQHDAWGIAGGVVVQSDWQELPWCVRPETDRPWALLFGRFNLCSPHESGRWVVHLTLNEPMTPGSRTVYRTTMGRTPVTIYTTPNGS